MIPIGYSYKRVFRPPASFGAPQVEDVYSLSDCLSKPFTDDVPHGLYNGHRLFDSPAVMRALAAERSIPLDGLALFYYEVHEAQYDEEQARWVPFATEAMRSTDVERPAARTLEGFDVATFSGGVAADCSPLSCNDLAASISTNRHCLLPSLDVAVQALESGRFANSEPGPFRIIAVYSVGG